MKIKGVIEDLKQIKKKKDTKLITNTKKQKLKIQTRVWIKEKKKKKEKKKREKQTNKKQSHKNYKKYICCLLLKKQVFFICKVIVGYKSEN